MGLNTLDHPRSLCSLTSTLYSQAKIQERLANDEIEGRESEAEITVGSAYVDTGSGSASQESSGLVRYTTVNWKYDGEEIMFLYPSKSENPLPSRRAFGNKPEDFSPTSASLIVYPVSSQEGQDLQFCFRTKIVTNYEPVYGAEMTVEGEQEYAMDEIVGSRRGDQVLDICLAELRIYGDGSSDGDKVFGLNQAGEAYKADTRFGFIRCQEFGAPGERLGDERPENLQIYAKMVCNLHEKLFTAARVEKPIEEAVVEEARVPSYLERVFLS